MQEVLIIRSVSFQQLDKNIKAIREKYRNCRISLLTHEHGVKLAEKYKNIYRVYVYPYQGSFSYGKPVKELENRDFDTVIIPVTNISGAGFSNVCLFALTIKAKKYVICNMVSDLREISRAGVFAVVAKNAVISVLASLFTVLIGVVVLPILPLLLRSLEKRM
ncbi:MAG: hypothetical protein CVU89_05010 [Firmicutes bacterium HGW-Firmicutes-14]|nr:MAG: hypothetical protein CVU89_05010 [Firmicutes bacterium HGW-Firmicutes-14]